MRNQSNVVEAIRRKIARENLLSGTLLPSTRVLAGQLGFNHSAVVRACNGLISAGILCRQGYKTVVGMNASSSPPMQGTIEIVSYLESFTQETGLLLTERGVSHHVTPLSYTLHPFPEAILRKIFAAKPAGVILALPRVSEAVEALLDSTKIPFVLCSSGVLRPDWSWAQTDHGQGMEKALHYLSTLGHRNIAHVSFADDSEGLAKFHRTACFNLNLRCAASMIWRPEVREFEAVRETVLAGLHRHPEVTAFTCDTPIACFAAQFLSIPKEMSVIGLGEEPKEAEISLHPTTVGLPNPQCIALWASTEMITRLQAVQAGRPMKSGNQVLFVPSLRVRQSTRAIATKGRPGEQLKTPASPGPDPWATWRKVYPYIKKIHSCNWMQLDLSKLANHSMLRHHGWLGAEPLEYFPAGLRSIHGVPFRVLDEERNKGRAVITFQSENSHSAEGKRLPTKAQLKLEARVKALYFLHGCGSARPGPFAWYVMHYKKGDAISVPLIPLGKSRVLAAKELGKLKPNIQDWWTPAFEQENFPHAYHAAVFNPADPAAYVRALYSLEWINPRPADEVSFIEVRVDPKAKPTLALIAATALL